MQNVILSPIDPESLIERIAQRTANLISENSKPNTDDKEFLSRKETAELLGINSATLYRWTVKGKINSYGISGKVYYKRAEVLDSIKQLK